MTGCTNCSSGSWATWASSRGITGRVSVASDGTQSNNDSRWPSISGDVRYVAFESYASNLVPADTNSQPDVFVHDRGAACPVLADLNCDGFVDFDDINPFVKLLIGGG